MGTYKLLPRQIASVLKIVASASILSLPMMTYAHTGTPSGVASERPFQAAVSCRPNGSGSCIGSLNTSRQRLTLEYVSVARNIDSKVPQVQKTPQLILTTTVNGVTVNHELNIPTSINTIYVPGGPPITPYPGAPSIPGTLSATTTLTAAQLVRIYADAASQLTVKANAFNPSPNGPECTFNLSGYSSN